MRKKRILLAMSGGIDSTVSALLLLQQGYELIGITLRTYDSTSTKDTEKEKGCCSADSLFEAKKMADKLGFQHHIVDVREQFNDIVINNFIAEYLHGRTPNPCILCNSHIKWKALLQLAYQYDCEMIATGHYARIQQVNNRFFIQKGQDTIKDQSYFLWALSQEELAHTIFPLGHLTKTEVRKIAYDLGYEKLSQKKESQEICFIPDNNYRHFLSTHVKDFKEIYKEGHFIDKEGNSLGKHRGYPHYTIGQRKGLQVAFGKPKYVCAIDIEKNTLTLGDKEDLLSSQLKIKEVNFHKYDSIPANFQAEVKIRYHDKGHLATIVQENNELTIHCSQPVEAVTPGQSAVIYENDDVIAGGFIL